MLESRPSRPLGAEAPGRASWCPGADHSQGVLAVSGLLCDPLASLLSPQLEASPSSSRDRQGGLTQAGECGRWMTAAVSLLFYVESQREGQEEGAQWFHIRLPVGDPVHRSVSDCCAAPFCFRVRTTALCAQARCTPRTRMPHTPSCTRATLT